MPLAFSRSRCPASAFPVTALPDECGGHPARNDGAGVGGGSRGAMGARPQGLMRERGGSRRRSEGRAVGASHRSHARALADPSHASPSVTRGGGSGGDRSRSDGPESPHPPLSSPELQVTTPTPWNPRFS
jgi:hypothetical protein